MSHNIQYGWFTRRYQHVFEWFALPEQRNHPVQAFKLHSLFFLFSVAQFFMSLFFVLGMLYISHPSIYWAPPLCLAMGWVAMGVLKLTGRTAIAVNTLILSIATYIVHFCWINDGFLHSTFAWLVLVPILSGMLTGSKTNTLIWTAITILVNLLGHYLSFEFGIKNYIHPDYQRAWTLIQQTAFMVCSGTIILFLLIQQSIQSKHLGERIISKQNLMRILVHDIANPLSVIRLSGQFLTNGGGEISPTSAGVRIEKNADRIMGIIQLIRDMEGWDGGQKKLELIPLDLVSILEDVITNNRNRLSSKKIKLNTVYSSDEHVWGHPTMLCEQIIGNLLTNAIKFSPEGATIDITVEPATRHEVKVIIRDYGIGIPAKIRKSLFDPLATTSRLGTAGEKGTGFGLPITKTCVELLGGRIAVDSRTAESDPKNHGTQVTVTLQRADTPQSLRDNS